MKRLLLTLLLPAMMLIGCKKGGNPTPTYQGVTINGVTWSEYNVDAFRTFTAKAEDFGMFYQWNNPAPWPATGAGAGWDASPPAGAVWAFANDPCPAGWRVPTTNELETLLDAANVINRWTTLNDISGRRFTDNATSATIFLPAAGVLLHSNGSINLAGNTGVYGTYSTYSDAYAWCLNFVTNAYIGVNHNLLSSTGYSVRCVKE